MRTETITVNYYQFNELSESAKENVINKHLEIFGYDLDGFIEGCKEKLEEIGFIAPQIEYSLSYSQGDGVAFSAEFDHIKLINHIYKTDNKAKSRLLNLVTNYDSYLALSFARVNYHYSHENTYIIELFTDFEDNRHSITCQLLDTYLTDLGTLKRDLCHEFRDRGYSEMEYKSSIEYMTQLCEANEYEFTENGELV